MERTVLTIVFAFVVFKTHCNALHLNQGMQPSTQWEKLLETMRNVAELDEPTASAIVEDTTPTVSEKQCGHRIRNASSGAGAYYVWCDKIMSKLKTLNNITGLSYGISTWDTWSQYLANQYDMPTHLYDCFTTENTSKPIEQFHTPYERHDICLGNTSKIDESGRKWETIRMHLTGRKPLSVLVKMDIEGFEWFTLPDFLNDPASISAVRQLDLEFHFCKYLGNQILSIFHKLLDNFVVTGRYPNDSQERIKEFNMKKDDICKANGLPGIFSVSYVNKRLLD